MRVAFDLIGSTGWTGGVNYLRNLLGVINEFQGDNVCPLLFAGRDTDNGVLKELGPLLGESPLLLDAWSPGSKEYLRRQKLKTLLLRDVVAEEIFNEMGVDVIFHPQNQWYGRIQIPTVAWLGDFQHRYLPGMFGFGRFLKREIGFRTIIRWATRIAVSSETSRCECEVLYPKSRGRVSVVSFAVPPDLSASSQEIEDCRMRFNLPEQYFFLPNQFWKHKNHLLVIEALRELKASGKPLSVVATGSLVDHRNKAYPNEVVNLVRRYGLEDQFRVLGFVERHELAKLLRGSLALVNPSLFEGWSTTVEEAKSLGVPVVLSDIPVHREQAPLGSVFFNPHSVSECADALWKCVNQLMQPPRPSLEALAARDSLERRRQWAMSFEEMLKDAHVGRGGT